jgi:hypothetical protein
MYWDNNVCMQRLLCQCAWWLHKNMEWKARLSSYCMCHCLSFPFIHHCDVSIYPEMDERWVVFYQYIFINIFIFVRFPCGSPFLGQMKSFNRFFFLSFTTTRHQTHIHSESQHSLVSVNFCGCVTKNTPLDLSSSSSSFLFLQIHPHLFHLT